jgi:hypothetical protein
VDGVNFFDIDETCRKGPSPKRQVNITCQIIRKKHITCQIVNGDLGKKLVAILRPYVFDFLIAPRIEMNNLFVRENDENWELKFSQF